MDLPLQRSRLALWLDLIRWDRPAGWLLLLWHASARIAGGFPAGSAGVSSPERS
jgi:4-hydroxybenzoate polyprenyltransferase